MHRYFLIPFNDDYFNHELNNWPDLKDSKFLKK